MPSSKPRGRVAARSLLVFLSGWICFACSKAAPTAGASASASALPAPAPGGLTVGFVYVGPKDDSSP